MCSKTVALVSYLPLLTCTNFLEARSLKLKCEEIGRRFLTKQSVLLSFHAVAFLDTMHRENNTLRHHIVVLSILRSMDILLSCSSRMSFIVPTYAWWKPCERIIPKKISAVGSSSKKVVQSSAGNVIVALNISCSFWVDPPTIPQQRMHSKTYHLSLKIQR